MSSPDDDVCILRELPCQRNGAIIESRTTDIFLAAKKSLLVKEITQRNCEVESKDSETIRRLLAERRKKYVKKKPNMTVKKLHQQMDQFFRGSVQNVAVVENSSISKMMAWTCLTLGKELEACCHLIASHAACLREQILYRSLKTELRFTILQEPKVFNLNPDDLDVDQLNVRTNHKNILTTLKELPPEWYIIQITAEHEHLGDIRHRIQPDESMYNLKPMHGIHITYLPTSSSSTVKPFCITLPKPSSNSSYDIRKEVESLLNTNKSDLTTSYHNNDLYWKMRKKQNDKMSSAINELETSWLREWRILLLADYTEHLDMVQDIYDMVDKLIADEPLIKEISAKTVWLLKKIASGACYLQSFEIERAVKYVLPKDQKLAKFTKNMIFSIIAKSKVMEPLKLAKRKTLILVLDECLDHISFESMKILKHQAVSRFPSLHILYALYNQHKNTIIDGYKIIRKSEQLGTFIVNPSLDLAKMEIRMKAFIDHWLPKWSGIYGVKPDLEFFKNALTKYNVLMYNGHGSGIQYLRGEEIERMRVMASVLLFGCNSIKLIPVGGRLPAYGISNQYLIGCSPCILGMLWEVTDAEIDKMTAEFISSWIPSSNEKPWSAVDLTAWSKGAIEYNKGSYKNSKTKTKVNNEEDMLVAVAKSKDICKQYMTSAAVIVRGLPVKLID